MQKLPFSRRIYVQWGDVHCKPSKDEFWQIPKNSLTELPVKIMGEEQVSKISPNDDSGEENYLVAQKLFS